MALSKAILLSLGEALGRNGPSMSDADYHDSPTFPILLLAYFPILAFLPWYAARPGSVLKWHAIHGLVLWSVVMVLEVANSWVSGVPYIGWLLGFLSAIALLFGGIYYSVRGIAGGLTGECRSIPLITDIIGKH